MAHDSWLLHASQVNDALSGAMILGAIGLYSPMAAVHTFAGSSMGVASALALGAPAAEIGSGLWGFNPALTSLAVSVCHIPPREPPFTLIRPMVRLHPTLPDLHLARPLPGERLLRCRSALVRPRDWRRGRDGSTLWRHEGGHGSRIWSASADAPILRGRHSVPFAAPRGDPGSHPCRGAALTGKESALVCSVDPTDPQCLI